MFLKNNLPGILWAGLILLLAGIPGNYFPEITSFWDWLSPDKLVHLFLFSIFVMLLIIGLYKQYCIENLRYFNISIIISVFIGIIYGGITELLQKFVFIGRSASIYDFIADSIGSILGVVLFFIFFKKKLSKTK